MLRVHRVASQNPVVLTRTQFKSNAPGATANSYFYKSNLQAVSSKAPDCLNVPLEKQNEGPLEASGLVFSVKSPSGAQYVIADSAFSSKTTTMFPVAHGKPRAIGSQIMESDRPTFVFDASEWSPKVLSVKDQEELVSEIRDIAEEKFENYQTMSPLKIMSMFSPQELLDDVCEGQCVTCEWKDTSNTELHMQASGDVENLQRLFKVGAMLCMASHAGFQASNEHGPDCLTPDVNSAVEMMAGLKISNILYGSCYSGEQADIRSAADQLLSLCDSTQNMTRDTLNIESLTEKTKGIPFANGTIQIASAFVQDAEKQPSIIGMSSLSPSVASDLRHAQVNDINVPAPKIGEEVPILRFTDSNRQLAHVFSNGETWPHPTRLGHSAVVHCTNTSDGVVPTIVSSAQQKLNDPARIFVEGTKLHLGTKPDTLFRPLKKMCSKGKSEAAALKLIHSYSTIDVNGLTFSAPSRDSNPNFSNQLLELVQECKKPVEKLSEKRTSFGQACERFVDQQYTRYCAECLESHTKEIESATAELEASTRSD